jgi:hypothetical protein
VQFVVLLAWLCVSNAVLMVPAMVLAESGARVWAVALALGLPVLRIAARHRARRGYFLLGYNDGPGGDFTRRSRRITRQDQPGWFRLLLVIEVVIVVLLATSIMARPRGRQRRSLRGP